MAWNDVYHENLKTKMMATNRKKKKKRIRSFKNWLLARDSASRINNVKANSTFFESESTHRFISGFRNFDR